MTPQEAAWVRANAWTQSMRSAYTTTPGFYAHCSCQSGKTSWCESGRHDKCHRATPLPSYETVICGRSGDSPRYFAEPYEHRSNVSATGPRHESLAMVWLADRVCRWVCPCECGHPQPAAVPVQGELFGATA